MNIWTGNHGFNDKNIGFPHRFSSTRIEDLWLPVYQNRVSPAAFLCESHSTSYHETIPGPWFWHGRIITRCFHVAGFGNFGDNPILESKWFQTWSMLSGASLIYIYMCVYMIYCNTMYVYYVSTGSCISNVSTMLSSQHLSITLSNLGTFLESKIWRKKRHDVSGNCRILKWRYCTI
jgi:hypothetical protein